MAAYDTELWHDFFVMTGGAAAALAGLIFVAVSLNHEAILEIPALPALAARTLAILIGLVLLSMVSLAPGQPVTALGLEITTVGLVVAVVLLGTTIRNLAADTPRGWRISLVGLSLVAAVPTVVAGASLLASSGGGLYWLLAGFVLSIVIAVYYGWILLIEIRR